MADERQLTEDLYGEGVITRRERDAAVRDIDRRECVFCEIAAGTRAPAGSGTILADLYGVLVFEPLNPVTPGHLLFVPSRHVENAATEPGLTGEVFQRASWWGGNRRQEFNLIVNSGAAATQTVHHLHVHYVPRWVGDGLSLPWTVPPPASTDGDTRTGQDGEAS